MENLLIIPAAEQAKRIEKISKAMSDQNLGCALISSNANIYYLTGRVYNGYLLILADDPRPWYLLKRPNHLCDERAIYIRKPENIVSELEKRGIDAPSKIGLELGHITYNDAMRLSKALGTDNLADISRLFSQARSTKTEYEIEKIRKSGINHERVYRNIPSLYQPGMTDLELQVEIEHMSRLDGCLGQFRISGDDMEIYMGNVLAGDNADAPSPYDFAMGGAGIDPSLPVGANGTIIKPGMSVMVDMNGNFTGYMTDMTRCFALGNLKQKAIDAHELSIEICHTLAEMGIVGTPAKELYEKAAQMAKAAGMEEYFMGHRQHAGFVGHGIGIEVNELPVLAPRSKDILQEGNVIAIEPKFVIPEAGAVGIENTYVVKSNGAMECLTKAPEQLIKFD